MLYHLPIFTIYQNIHKIANTSLEKKSRIEFNEKTFFERKKKKKSWNNISFYRLGARYREKETEYKFNPTLFDDARNTKFRNQKYRHNSSNRIGASWCFQM